MRPSTRPRFVARAVMAVLAIALLSLFGCGDDAPSAREGDVESPSEVLGDADEGIPGVQAIRVFYERPVHAEGTIDYGLTPPAGGLHDPVWWSCGFYDEPVRDENVGHALEHGAVWLSYAPDLAAADIDVIHELARENPKVLAAPYEGLDEGVAVVATAWARQLTLDAVDDPRLADFVERYQDGEQSPEVGASCAGTPYGQPIP